MQSRLLLTLPLFVLACDGGKSESTPSGDSGTDSQDPKESQTDSEDSEDSQPDSPGHSEDSEVPTPLEIRGQWVDDWGGDHQITDSLWQMGASRFNISSWDNNHHYLVAQNDAINTYFPSLWSRFDWTWSNNTLYYCQTVYDGVDEQAAENAPAANNGDLSTGCGGFSWSRLRPRLELRGTWVDDWGSTHSINEDLWAIDQSLFHIRQYDNQAHYAIAQNDAANTWYPEMWSRMDWMWDGSSYYYCQTAYSAATEAEALATAAANAGDLATGCGGFSWSRLSEPLDIIGSYVDNWGGTHEISQSLWVMGSSQFHIQFIDNNGSYVVAQNDAANAWSPGLYSRLDWSWDGSDLYYCQIAYDAADFDTARQNDTANRGDLSTGCGGFSWSQLLAP